MRWLYLMILNPWSSVVKTRHEVFFFKKQLVFLEKEWCRIRQVMEKVLGQLNLTVWKPQDMPSSHARKNGHAVFFKIKDSRPFFHVVGPPEVHQCFGSSRYRHLNPQTGPFSVKSNDQLDAWKESPKTLLENSCEEKYTCARIDKL